MQHFATNLRNWYHVNTDTNIIEIIHTWNSLNTQYTHYNDLRTSVLENTNRYSKDMIWCDITHSKYVFNLI